jgi:hypothetical protein
MAGFNPLWKALGDLTIPFLLDQVFDWENDGSELQGVGRGHAARRKNQK